MPTGQLEDEPIILNLDEYEAIRLMDREGSRNAASAWAWPGLQCRKSTKQLAARWLMPWLRAGLSKFKVEIFSFARVMIVWSRNVSNAVDMVVIVANTAVITSRCKRKT